MLSIQDIPHRQSQMYENDQPKRYVNQSQMSHPKTNYCIDNAKARLRILQKIAFFFKKRGATAASMYSNVRAILQQRFIGINCQKSSPTCKVINPCPIQPPHNLRRRGKLVCQKHLGLFSVQILSCRLSLKVFFLLEDLLNFHLGRVCLVGKIDSS